MKITPTYLQPNELRFTSYSASFSIVALSTRCHLGRHWMISNVLVWDTPFLSGYSSFSRQDPNRLDSCIVLDNFQDFRIRCIHTSTHSHINPPRLPVESTIDTRLRRMSHHHPTCFQSFKYFVCCTYEYKRVE